MKTVRLQNQSVWEIDDQRHVFMLVLRTRSTMSRMTHNGSKVFTLDSNDVIKPTVQNMSRSEKLTVSLLIRASCFTSEHCENSWLEYLWKSCRKARVETDKVLVHYNEQKPLAVFETLGLQALFHMDLDGWIMHIDNEALANVFAVRKFHQYLTGAFRDFYEL